MTGKLAAHSVKKIAVADAVGMTAFALLTLGFVFGLIAPLGTRERMHEARVLAVARQRQRATELESQIHAAGERVEAVRARIAASPLRIRSQDALNERLAGVVGLADACGLRVQDLKPGDGVPLRRYVVLPVRLTGRGKFPDAADFLSKLHAQQPDVALRSMKLTAAPDASAACEFEFEWFAAPSNAAKTTTASVALP